MNYADPLESKWLQERIALTLHSYCAGARTRDFFNTEVGEFYNLIDYITCDALRGGGWDRMKEELEICRAKLEKYLPQEENEMRFVQLDQMHTSTLWSLAILDDMEFVTTKDLTAEISIPWGEESYPTIERRHLEFHAELHFHLLHALPIQLGCITLEFKKKDFGREFDSMLSSILTTLMTLRKGGLPDNVDTTTVELNRFKKQLNTQLQLELDPKILLLFRQIVSSIGWIVLRLREGMKPFEREDAKAKAAEELKVKLRPVLDALENPRLRNTILDEIYCLGDRKVQYWDAEWEPEDKTDKSIYEFLIVNMGFNRECNHRVGICLVDPAEAEMIFETCTIFAEIKQKNPTLENFEVVKLEAWKRLEESALKTYSYLRKQTPYIEDYI